MDFWRTVVVLFRRWYITLPAFFATLGVAAAAYSAVPVQYESGSVLVLTFNAIGGGTYTLTANPSGTITSYTYEQDPYRGFIWPIYFSAYYPMTLELDFTSNTGGSFSGTVYTSAGNSSVSGNFTLQ